MVGVCAGGGGAAEEDYPVGADRLATLIRAHNLLGWAANQELGRHVHDSRVPGPLPIPSGYGPDEWH
jgi:hypothetical protein